MKIRNVLMASVLAFSIAGTALMALGLNGNETRADSFVTREVELDTVYDLDFSTDTAYSKRIYQHYFTADETTDYVLTTYGSQKIHLYSFCSELGTFSTTDLVPLTTTATDEYNFTNIYSMTAGKNYYFNIGRGANSADHSDFSGENDVKVVFSKYKDTSKVIANFDSTDFPDDNFRAYITDLADYYKDGKLTQYEADKIKYINVSGKHISDLKGIGYFDKITSLQCQNNDLSSLDLSRNRELRILYCYNNSLGSLDLSRNTKLTALECYNNSISSLDLKNNTNMVDLDLRNNKLTKLDLSSCPYIVTLRAEGNKDLSNLNITGCKQLRDLRAENCALTSLNVSGSKMLSYLDVDDNKITSLDVSSNPNINELHCGNNGMRSLKVSGCSDLEYLSCSDNQLTSLDLSGAVKLECLYTRNNNLTKLDVSGSPNLSYVYYNGTKQSSSIIKPYFYYEYDDLYLDMDEGVTVTAKEPDPDKGIAIDKETFPCPIFREYIKENFDLSKDGYLSEYEIFNAREISFSDTGPSDLTGIKIFTSLKKLSVINSQYLKTVDLSGLKKLEELYLSRDFENINIEGCTGLRMIDVNGNKNLKSIDLSYCPELTYLSVNGCSQIESLDLSKCPKIRILRAYNMDNLKKLDITDNPYLVKSYLDGTPYPEKNYTEYILDLGRYELYLDNDLDLTYKIPDPTASPTPTEPAKPTPSVPAKPTPTVPAKPTGSIKPTEPAKPTKAPEDKVFLTLNKKEANVVCAKTLTLKATLKGSTSKITWKSSDKKTATVDANGKITTKQAGQVTITATAAGKKAECVVTVLYKDVTNSKDFWYAPTNYLTAKGEVKGYDKQTKFKPANDCTRAQMVTFLYRLQGEPKVKSTTCKFKDVKKTDYFYKPVIWASENSITTGVSKDKFDPQRVCTRAQTVTFLWRMAKKPTPKTAKNKFPDVKKTDYFYKATLWASEKKILAGLPDGTFNPQGKCLRRQMVTFLYKYDRFINKKG